MEETQRNRLPDAKRRLVSAEYHYFIALNEDTGEPIGTAGWLIPNTSNARHHRRKITLYERIAGLAYSIYDAVVNTLLPHKLYALFYPEGAAMLQRQVRWRAEMAKATQPVNKAAHEKAGYWHLSFICEFSGTRQAVFLADQDEQAYYPSMLVEE